MRMWLRAMSAHVTGRLFVAVCNAGFVVEAVCCFVADMTSSKYLKPIHMQVTIADNDCQCTLVTRICLDTFASVL